jgi:hypothetical protein
MDQKKKKGARVNTSSLLLLPGEWGGEAIKWSSSAVLANIDFSSFFFAISYGFAGSRIGLPCARGDWRLRGKAQRLRQMVAMATAVWEYLFIPIKYNDSLTCRALQKRTANSSRPCKNNSRERYARLRLITGPRRVLHVTVVRAPAMFPSGCVCVVYCVH